MTKQEALQLIDNTVAMINLSREAHVQLQTAIAILGNAIREATPEEVAPKKGK